MAELLPVVVVRRSAVITVGSVGTVGIAVLSRESGCDGRTSATVLAVADQPRVNSVRCVLESATPVCGSPANLW
jgi:hypothetical protein